MRPDVTKQISPVGSHAHSSPARRTGWCADNRPRLLEVRHAHPEIFARTMEQEGRMGSTVARRLSPLCNFYQYCHLEGFLDRIGTRQRMCAARESTTSPAPSSWTATSSARCWSRPVSAQPAITR
jgi:hypothetical protein